MNLTADIVKALSNDDNLNHVKKLCGTCKNKNLVNSNETPHNCVKLCIIPSLRHKSLFDQSSADTNYAEVIEKLEKSISSK